MFLYFTCGFGLTNERGRGQQVRKGRQETSMVELGSAGQIEDEEENAQAIETGTGTMGIV